MGGLADSSRRETSATQATLAELAQKLAELRAHLEHVSAGLDARREGNRGIDAEPVPARESSFAKPKAAVRLRCHECGSVGPSDGMGWTLRLCGDDELHTFCPDCDHRYFNGNGGNGTPVERDLG
jgi:hypothetical protein